mgnify:CR=1 FL=1
MDNKIKINQKQLLENKISELEAEIESFDTFHPRAMKLLRKKKNFIVVADDEPYFLHVYFEIREHKKEIGRWTANDEKKYQEARKFVIQHDY